MAVAKVFRSGNSQAVRLPKEFRLDANEMEISRVGDGLLLRPIAQNLSALIPLLKELSELIDLPDDLPPQEREGL